MQKVVAKIKGTKVASIRSRPWDPLNDYIVEEVKSTEPLIINSDDTVYDWQNNKFYAVIDTRGIARGYIRASLLTGPLS